MKNKNVVKSVYIHIPFCDTICSYCDFCKMIYNKTLVDKYLISLEKEIKNNYHKEKLKTIYIGGGTPSCLSYEELNKLLEILSYLNKDKEYEYTVEMNIENTTLDKLQLLKKYGVNRLSFGVQTTRKHLLQKLNRFHTIEHVKKVIGLASKLGFSNINVDLIYALPSETLNDVKEDLTFLLSLPITHISTYSLILEEHTKFYLDNIKPLDEELDFEMYCFIKKYLKAHGFVHYEISNFCKAGYSSKHNLTYWNNNYYYGFGLSAAGYIGDIRYTNTRSINHYCNGNFRLVEEKLTKKDKMTYEMILGLRKLEGVSKKRFLKRYECKVEEAFSYQEELNKNLLVEDDDFIKVKEDKLYISNEIMMTFVGGNYE